MFLVAQATVFFGGHEYLQRTTGLTYADYVHQGFGQLIVATALTLLVVWAASHKASVKAPEDRLWLRGPSACCACRPWSSSPRPSTGCTSTRRPTASASSGCSSTPSRSGSAWSSRRHRRGDRAERHLAPPSGPAGCGRDAAESGRDQPGRLDRPAKPGPLRADGQDRLVVLRRPLRRCCADDRGILAEVRDCAFDFMDQPSDDDWLEWNLGRWRAERQTEDGLGRFVRRVRLDALGEGGVTTAVLRWSHDRSHHRAQQRRDDPPSSASGSPGSPRRTPRTSSRKPSTPGTGTSTRRGPTATRRASRSRSPPPA